MECLSTNSNVEQSSQHHQKNLFSGVFSKVLRSDTRSNFSGVTFLTDNLGDCNVFVLDSPRFLQIFVTILFSGLFCKKIVVAVK